MDARTYRVLQEINRRFYAEFGAAFSQKRMRLQPGVLRVLPLVRTEARVLDLGCGNGGVLRALVERGFHGLYVGVDFSPALLKIARSSIPSGAHASFFARDLTTPNWPNGLPKPFDFVFAFSVLHHIPAAETRKALVSRLRALIPKGALFILSNWQFLNSERLRARIQPWETVGLSQAKVEPGDYLLDWRHQGHGLRYVHHFSEEELQTLAAQTGFRVRDSFYSDGEGSRLGLYQIWEAV